MKPKFKSHNKFCPFQFTNLIIISITLSFLFSQTSAVEILQSTDLKPSSILLNNNKILTYTNNYLTLTNSATAEMISQQATQERYDENNDYKRVAWLELSDKTILVYYGTLLFHYAEDWTFIESKTITSDTQHKYYVATLINTQSPQGFLLGYVIDNPRTVVLSWFDENWNETVKITELDAAQTIAQVACLIYQSNNYWCCYAVFQESVQCEWYDNNLVKIEPVGNSNAKWNFQNNAGIRMIQHSSNEYLFCCITHQNTIGCNHVSISSTSLISFGTGATLITSGVQFNDSVVYYGIEKGKTSEYWIPYSSGSDIKVLTIDFDLNTVGTWFEFARGLPYNYSFKFFWLYDNYVVIYDKAGWGFYANLEEAVVCSDFCLSTDLSTTVSITFNEVVSTSTIVFKSSNFSGTFKTSSGNVVIDQDYVLASTLFEYISSGSSVKEMFTYQAVGSTSNSNTCSGVIYNGIPYNCNCPVTSFHYNNECWVQCYDYLYSDTVNMWCVNCKSENKYWYENQCVDISDVPEGYFVSNDVYNVMSSCVSPCKTCVTTETNCLTYLPGLDPNVPPVCISGEYWDTNTNTCEQCHVSCWDCSMNGTDAATNCDNCASGYISYNFNPTQCYEECNDSTSERWYIDASRNVICITGTSCPNDYPIYVTQTNQCVDSCSITSDCQFCTSQPSDWYIYNDTCVSSCPTGTSLDQLTGRCETDPTPTPGPGTSGTIQSDEPKENIMGSIHQNITDYLDWNHDVIIIGSDYTVEISDSNSTSVQIDFGECEIIVRNYYQIPSTEKILVVKLILTREEEWTNQVEYRLYTPSGELADLNWCKNVTITIKYPVKEPNDLDIPLIEDYLDKGIDVFNSSEEFFNDICYPFTDNNGKDITITDRQNDIYQNVSLCEEQCNYTEFNTTDLIVTCECNIKTEVSTKIVENTVNAEFFKNSWNSILDELNYEIIKCYKLLWDWDNLKANIGFWMFFGIMLLHLPLFIWMGMKGYKPIKINMIIDGRVGCPPKRRQWYNNETVVSDWKHVENEGTEGDDIIAKETNQGNTTGNHSERQSTRDQAGYKKHGIKLQQSEQDKWRVNNLTYRESNNEVINYINHAEEDVDTEYNFAPLKREKQSNITNDNFYQSNIVFNNNKAHLGNVFGEVDIHWKNKREEPMHSKKTTSSFVQNKNNQKPRRVSLSEQIHGKKNTNDTSDDRFSNNQLMIINNISHEASMDKESQNTNHNLETDSALKAMKNRFNNRRDYDIKKRGVVDSIDIVNLHGKDQISLRSFGSSDYFAKHGSSFSKRPISKNDRNNSHLRNAEIIHVGNSSSSKAPSINGKSDGNASKKTMLSMPSSTAITKALTVKGNNNVSHKSKFNPLSQRNSNSNDMNPLVNMAPSLDFLDDYTLEEANIYDTRTFCMKYYICLKAKQGIWQTFVLKAPFELKVIRIIMFIFTNCVELAFNTVFYTDSMVSNSYNYKGSVGFWFNLQNSIIVTVFSNIAGWILCTLLLYWSNSNDTLKMIYEKKVKEDQGKYYTWVKRGLSCLTVKLSIFVFFEVAFMLFFWYYIAIFCIVFKNNQFGWWQAGLMSWLIGNWLPFGVSLLIVILRDIAMRNKWGKLYGFSWWIYRF